MTGVHRIAQVALLLLGLAGLALCAAPAVAAQDTRQPVPLTKSDLVRLLSGGTYTQGEVVSIIERSCLAFTPSSEDRVDLERLGATTPVLSAMDACARRSAAPVTLSVSSPRLAGRVGGSVDLVVRARRGETPEAGVSLVLVGSDRVAGGADQPLRATTDASGTARFRIPVGTRAGQIPLRVAAASGAALASEPPVVLVVAAGPPVRVQVLPGELRVPAEGTRTTEVRATAFDRFGNPVPNAVLEFSAVSLDPESATGDPPFGPTRRTTDPSGSASLTVELEPELGSHRIEVLSEGLALAAIPVHAPPAAAVAAAEPGAEARSDAERDPVDRQTTGTPPAAEPEAERDDTPGEQRDAAAEAEAELRATLADADGALARGDPETAIGHYQAYLSTRRDDSDVWFRLGEAWIAAGNLDEAERVFARAAALDPALRAPAEEALAAAGPSGEWARFGVWGGATVGEDEATGIVAVEATVYPVGGVFLSGRYDDALGLHNPAFVRRTLDLRSFYGGGGIRWGEGGRLRTSFEVGRREHTADLLQFVYHAEQSVALDHGAGEVAFGGWFGRWFDRDDWVGYGRGHFRVTEQLAVRPAIYVGETLTTLPDTSRIVESEVRGYLGLALRPIPAIELAPSFGVGAVSSETDALSGTLLDGRFQLLAEFSRDAALQVFVRHQRPPGGDPFTAVAAGLRFGIQR